MRHPSTQALYTYWTTLKGTRPAPRRAEIDPRALAPHLGDILMLDSSATGHALRLAGSRMEAELGAPLVGTPFAALFSEASRREALQALALVTAENQPLLLGVRLALPDETMASDAARPDSGQWVRPHWANRRWPTPPAGQAERRARRPGTGELLLLPLEHRNALGARVLGAFGLNTPSLHLPAQRVTLEVTSERILGESALAGAGPGLISGATLVAQGGMVQLFSGIDFPLTPQNDS